MTTVYLIAKHWNLCECQLRAEQVNKFWHSKNEQTKTICNNMNESHKYNIGKKLKRQILHDSIYAQLKNRQN